MKERLFSTFQAARLCGVYHTTVINWIKTGKLKAYTTPGGHRRIHSNDLLEFMRHFEMPIPKDLLTRPKRLLIVEDDASVRRMLMRTFSGVPNLEVVECEGGIEALIEIGRTAPDLLVLDIRIPQVNGLEICRILRSSEATRPIRIVCVTGEALSAEEQAFLEANTAAVFRKPLSTEAFKQAALDLLDRDESPSPFLS